MESYLIYIGKSALAAGAFYIAFLLLFQNQKHFVFNRFYLPVSLALSFVIPLITFTTIKLVEPTAPLNLNSFAYLANTSENIAQPEFVLQWYHYLIGLYILGAAGFLFHLLLGHLKAMNIIKFSRLKLLFETEVNITPKDVHPFSFFNKIVVSENTLDSPNLQMIVNHEYIHVKEKHTLDILFVELLFLAQWFNPFAWLLKDAVKNNLEYKTDHQITKTNNPKDYQLAMVALADKQGVAPFLTALNGSQLKNRIIMMKKKTENKYALLKQLVILPLLAILVMGLSNREIKTEIIQPEKQIEINQSVNEFQVFNEKDFLSMVIIVDGKVIPSDNAGLKILDFSKGFDSGEVIKVLNIDTEKVKATVFSFDTETPTLFIRTSDYVVGSNPNFDELTKKGTNSISSSPPKETFYAVNNQLVSKSEFKDISEKGVESIVILTDEDATQKYGDNANGIVVDVKTPGKTKLSINEKHEHIVKGKVTDKSGSPISGASILVKGKTIGTITDVDGNYQLKLDGENETLVFVMFGFEKQEIKVDEKNEINVQLHKEIIVVEYGAKDTKLNKNVVHIRVNDDSENQPIYIVDGKEDAPLIIIDGKEMASLEEIAPDDIESISVLKGASAVKLYGEKGKNGVILIETKKKFDASDKIIIHAQGSLSKEKPLIVVDGIISEYKSLDDIDPENIEKVDVLKGKSGTELYGERGKNGVILIYLKPIKITSELQLRNFIAKKIKYPVLAQEANREKVVKLSVQIDNSGNIISINETEGYIKIRVEVVVTGNKIKETVVAGYGTKVEAENARKIEEQLLVDETKRVINKMPGIDISELKGKTIGITVKFVLQD